MCMGGVVLRDLVRMLNIWKKFYTCKYEVSIYYLPLCGIYKTLPSLRKGEKRTLPDAMLQQKICCFSSINSRMFY